MDQNTDRMWYVIGAVIIGAAIMMMSLNTLTDSFESVGELMGATTNQAERSVNKINGLVYTEDEIDHLIENEGYIPVATADELNNIRYDVMRTYGEGSKWEGNYTSGVEKKYIQVAKIDLGSLANFEPIGNSQRSFKGIYDGGGHVVANLTIDYGANDHVGLFGRVSGGTFENIKLNHVNVHGGLNVGGLFGLIQDSTVNNVSVVGNISSVDGRVGGLAGWQNHTALSNSSFSGKVSGSEDHVGGLVGYVQSDSSIITSHSISDVSGTMDNVGGLVGYVSASTIEKSYASGNVSGVGNRIGGLVGWQVRTTTTNSFSTGDVSGEKYVGGFIGYQQTSSQTVNNYAIGSVNGNSYVGGFLGFQSDSTSTINSYYNEEISGQSGSDDGVGKTTAEMKQVSTYNGWDFDAIWELQAGRYPTLR